MFGRTVFVAALLCASASYACDESILQQGLRRTEEQAERSYQDKVRMLDSIQQKQIESQRHYDAQQIILEQQFSNEIMLMDRK